MIRRIPHVAYHEAGHAVIGILVGLRISGVNIVKEQECGFTTSGRTHFSFYHGDSARDRDDAERATTAVLAGEQAERLWCKQKPSRRVRSSRHTQFSSDRVRSEHYLRPFVPDSADRQRTIKRLKKAVRDLLAKHWSCVEAVAARLSERKALSEKEVEQLVVRP